MDSKEALIEVLAAQHNEWLQHPVTQTLIKKIVEHKMKFVKIVSRDASNPLVSDSALRHSAINIRNTDAILTLITETEVFIGQSNNQQNKE